MSLYPFHTEAKCLGHFQHYNRPSNRVKQSHSKGRLQVVSADKLSFLYKIISVLTLLNYEQLRDYLHCHSSCLDNE